MGTSKGYDMPSGGNWTPLKTDATSFVKNEGRGSVSSAKLLADYLRANGGARSMASGSGTGTRPSGDGKKGDRGGVGGGGSAARSAGRKLGGFLSSVGAVGLDEALRDAGLVDLIGKPAKEVVSGLLDILAEPGSTLDEHVARLALAKLNDDLLRGAETYEDVERALSQALDQRGLAHILGSFFGHYLYERFCRDFYENWVKRVGSIQATRSLKSIKDYIELRIKAKLIGRDFAKVKWRTREGLRLSQQVLQDTLEVFEVIA
jgi:hypothetical protein